MAVPKQKKSKSKTRMGRAHHHLTTPGWISCPNCKEPKARHRVCPHCGHYRGEEVVEVEATI